MARDEPFDCSAYPELCKEPFNCDKWAGPAALMEAMERAGSDVDWKVNYQLLCVDPADGPFAAKCAAGDLDGAGKVQREMTNAAAYGDGKNVDELYASYCFMDGKCVDSSVTNDTTIDDMMRMCDERFGRDVWTNATEAVLVAEHTAEGTEANKKGEVLTKFIPSYDNGLTSAHQVRCFALGACASGTYHCEVRTCQANYCNDEHYIKKYGHYLKDYGWVQ